MSRSNSVTTKQKFAHAAVVSDSSASVRRLLIDLHAKIQQHQTVETAAWNKEKPAKKAKVTQLRATSKAISKELEDKIKQQEKLKPDLRDWQALENLEQVLLATEDQLHAVQAEIYFPEIQGYRLRAGLGSGVYMGISDFWMEKVEGKFQIQVSSSATATPRLASHGSHTEPTSPVPPRRSTFSFDADPASAGGDVPGLNLDTVKDSPGSNESSPRAQSVQGDLPVLGSSGNETDSIPRMAVKLVGIEPGRGISVVVRADQIGITRRNLATIRPEMVLVQVEFQADITVFCDPRFKRKWRIQRGGVKVKVMRLETQIKGRVSLPDRVARELVNMIIPYVIRKALLASLPLELAAFVLEAEGRILQLEGVFDLAGTPLAKMEAKFDSDAAKDMALHDLLGLQPAQLNTLKALRQFWEPAAGTSAKDAAAAATVPTFRCLFDLVRYLQRYSKSPHWGELVESWQRCIDVMLAEHTGDTPMSWISFQDLMQSVKEQLCSKPTFIRVEMKEVEANLNVDCLARLIEALWTKMLVAQMKRDQSLKKKGTVSVAMAKRMEQQTDSAVRLELLDLILGIIKDNLNNFSVTANVDITGGESGGAIKIHANDINYDGPLKVELPVPELPVQKFNQSGYAVKMKPYAPADTPSDAESMRIVLYAPDEPTVPIPKNEADMDLESSDWQKLLCIDMVDLHQVILFDAERFLQHYQTLSEADRRRAGMQQILRFGMVPRRIRRSQGSDDDTNSAYGDPDSKESKERAEKAKPKMLVSLGTSEFTTVNLLISQVRITGKLDVVYFHVVKLLTDALQNMDDTPESTRKIWELVDVFIRQMGKYLSSEVLRVFVQDMAVAAHVNHSTNQLFVKIAQDKVGSPESDPSLPFILFKQRFNLMDLLTDMEELIQLAAPPPSAAAAATATTSSGSG